MKKKLFCITLTTTLTLTLGLSACSSNAPKDSGMDIFTPGAYEVTVEGHNAPITVVTTFSKDKIEKIDVVEQAESAGVGDTAMQTVADEIIAKQGFDVDIVSAATYSSYALLEAVSVAAVHGAGADTKVIKMPEQSAGEGSKEAVEGGLVGVGKGLGGDIEVQVIMDGDKIEAVDVLSHNETPGISDRAISDIPAAIVEAQSSDVDIISGATLSSNGIMDAVKDAMSKQ